MALKRVKVMQVSDAILIMKNALLTKTFDAEFMSRTAAVHLLCYETNFSEIDFWLQKVEKTIYPLSKFEKNVEKIFFNFRLFSGAGMNNMQETPVKTISDVKKMHLTRFYWRACQYMALKQVGEMQVSDANLIVNNALLTKTFDAEFMSRTAAVHLLCYETNFSEIDFWLQKVEKTIPFLNSRKMMKIFFLILGYFPLQAWITCKKHPLKRYPTWRKCI
jgi:hypothetical protein